MYEVRWTVKVGRKAVDKSRQFSMTEESFVHAVWFARGLYAAGIDVDLYKCWTTGGMGVFFCSSSEHHEIRCRF